ncbi:FkbM family methyltransferase [Rubritalea profundi]|uniref:Methyltransferase FkbM domain-containing protein n=1 Tax=Rubritalea profundi TaxID=1658618 RepID=A0A2S7U0I7_9BACT|nr:FkbM family methyltransferase [Rubritalea profundi]PQJ28090.1 hypothetical protein BSZ32_05940 [Rubritalea profundi]
MKSLIPLALRIKIRQFIDRHWSARHYDSPFFGWMWSVINSDYKTSGLSFKLPKDMMPMGFRSRFFFDVYEIQERELALKHIKPSDSILELGACIGVVSCVCNELLDDKQRHVVVEANPLLIPWLEKNKSLNSAQFTIEHAMLSDSSDGSFRIEKFIVSGSANTTTGKRVTVPVISFTESCSKHHFSPSVIVMDIEGGELNFITENFSTIENCSDLRMMIIEMHPFIIGEEAVREVKKLLKALRFECLESMGLVEVWKRQ